jgi:hypothetical protein
MLWTVSTERCDLVLTPDHRGDFPALESVSGLLEAADGEQFPIKGALGAPDDVGQRKLKFALPRELLNGRLRNFVLRADMLKLECSVTISPTDEANLPLQASLNEKGRAEGEVTYFDGEILRGWAYDPAAPNERLSVEVFVDNQRISTVLAEERRAVLANRGINDGHCGFSKSLPATILDGRHVIACCAVGANGPLERGLIEVDPVALKRFVVKEVISRIGRLERLFE